MYQIVAQAIGIVAMFFNILSYQQKSAKRIIACQLFGAVLFAINFSMLGAYIGAILNVIAMIRAILFLKRETFHTDSIGWLIGFGAAYVGAYILNFTVLGKEPTPFNLIVECLPVVGMFMGHLAFRHNSAKIIRRFSLVSSTSWLIFNVIAVAIAPACSIASTLP